MAIQVRLDLTPQEFDLLRRALDTHKRVLEAAVDDRESDPGDRRNARADILRTNDLLAKVR